MANTTLYIFANAGTTSITLSALSGATGTPAASYVPVNTAGKLWAIVIPEALAGRFHYQASNGSSSTGQGVTPSLADDAGPYYSGEQDSASGGGEKTVNVDVPLSVVESAQSNSGVQFRSRGTRWSFTVENISSINDADEIWFGIKDGDVEDDDALIIAKLSLPTTQSGDGLVRLNKARSSNATDAAITHETYSDGDGTKHRFNIIIDAAATKDIAVTDPLQPTNLTPGESTASLAGYSLGWKLTGTHDRQLGAIQRLQVQPDIVREV